MRPNELERTALGVAYLAGAGVRRRRVPDDIERSWTVDRVFEPEMDDTMRAALYGGWCDAVRHSAPRRPSTWRRSDSRPATTGRSH